MDDHWQAQGNDAMEAVEVATEQNAEVATEPDVEPSTEEREPVAVAEPGGKEAEGSQRPGAPARRELPAGGNVDRIRDILFGSHMRDYERRFARVEQRLQQEVAGLREELHRRFDSLESYIREEVSTLGERHESEREQRVAALREIARELRDGVVSLEERIASMDERFGRKIRSLHEQILSQSKTLEDEIQEKHRDVVQALEREAGELHQAKVDRLGLSELFMELSLRLSDRFDLDQEIEEGEPSNE